MTQLPDPADLNWPPRRIVLHWTAGASKASNNDRKHYHVLIEDDGTPLLGNPSLSANCRNIPPVAPAWSHDHPEGYAAHTSRFNSWSMGISLCGMLDAVEGHESDSAFPLTIQQTDALIKLLARACKLYGLWPTEHRIMTHEEVQRLHGVEQPGKWDIRWLPIHDGIVEGNEVGPWIRTTVAAHICRRGGGRN